MTLMSEKWTETCDLWADLLLLLLAVNPATALLDGIADKLA